ncbi:NADP-binding protein [Gigaspora margarita]|uniref:NADP-binding protein n=1 Tax=Gigaspora margarita TaxID=4874 RepID=A0A8H3WUJ0_GIGMA|nr:NADP-binding protein [Gigaspora margarita]
MNHLDHYNHHQKIAVCATDRWFGNVIARSLLLDGKRNIVVRCLAQDTNKHVKKLDRLGGEVHRIEYDRPETIKDALHGVNFLIFISEADKNRVKEAKIMADAAADRDVDNAIILSVEGAEDGDGKVMNDFREIEKEVCQRIKHSCVIRNAFLQQAFFLWSPNIEDRGEINMTPRESNEWAPVNLDDLVCAIAKLMLQEGKVVTELNKKHRYKVYCLTGPELVTGRKITETINRVIEGRGDVEYRTINRRQLEDYLCSLDGHQDDDECDRDRDRELDSDSIEDTLLEQRDAIYLIQRGLASLHESLADFFRNTQQSLECGKSNFIEGVHHLVIATALFEEVNRQFSARNYYGPNRNALGMQDKVTGSGRYRDVQEERFNRNVAACVDTMRDIIARLKSIDIERFELDVQDRLVILSNIKDAVEVIENIQKSLDVVPFLLDERHRHDRHPRPFLPLSKYEIELILERLDYVKEGKADHVSDDYKKITGEKPTRIKSFFEDNSESFRPGKNTRPRRPRDSDDKSDTLIMGRRISKL